MLAIEWFGIHWYPSGPFTVQTQCLASSFVRFIEVEVGLQGRLFEQTGDRPRKVSCHFLKTTRPGIRYFRSIASRVW
jgi:hypothetical protein